MTRAMFVTVLGRAAREVGIPVQSGGAAPFEDVDAGAWYSDYVAWAFEEGIVQGVSGTRFGTGRAISREEAATLLHRFLARYDIRLPGTAEPAFPDAGEISGWAYDAVREAVRTGLITGHPDGRFAPQQTATRAQVAVIFMRLIDAFDDRLIEDEPDEAYPPDEEETYPEEEKEIYPDEEETYPDEEEDASALSLAG
jgi:dextranase